MLLIVLLLPTIQAALTCTSASGDVGGFKACTFDALGSGGASDTSSACAGNTGDAYNACICQAASNVVKCYSDHCAGDAGLRRVIADQANHCNVKATTTALTPATLSTKMDASSSDYFTFSSIGFSTIPASVMISLAPITTSTSSTGVNLDNLPPFPDSGALKDHVFVAFVFSVLLSIMMFLA